MSTNSIGEQTTRATDRYGRLLTCVNWALAALCLQMLVAGFFKIAATPNGDPEKVLVVRWHMALGILVVALLIARLLLRKRAITVREQGKTQSVAGRLLSFAHSGFFALIIPVAGSGLAAAIVGALPILVFWSWDHSAPTGFDGSVSQRAHLAFSILLVGVAGLYVAAAFWRLLTRERRPG